MHDRFERDLERSARVTCGDGAAIYGESTDGQWMHLAQWAGFESWGQVVEAARGRAFEDVLTPRASREQKAVAAVQRRHIWETNSGSGRGRGE